MDDWFDKRVREIIGRALADAANWAATEASSKLTDFLKDLKVGEPVSPNPLLVAIDRNQGAQTVRLLFKGDVKIGGASAFARVESVVNYGSIDLTHRPPIKIVDWPVVLGNLSYKVAAADGVEPWVHLALRFQRQSGVFGAGGNVSLMPFPRLAAYGAFGEGRFVVSLDAKLPNGSTIPLGPTGLGLWGIGGTFAHNFKPRLPELRPQEVADITEPSQPTAMHYVHWAREITSSDRIENQWLPARAGESATGIGIRAYLGTADSGFIFTAAPAGIAFLTPGALIMGGQGRILKQANFMGDFYAVLDFDSGTLALSVAMRVELRTPIIGGVLTLKGSGQMDMFFSFTDPAAWYFDIGREDARVKLEVLQDIPVINLLFSQQAEAYLRINHHRIAFGAKVAIGGEFRLIKILTLIARLSAEVAALIARDPMLVKAQLWVRGELGVKVWKFSFLLKGEASPLVYFPRPTRIAFNMDIKLDLPWPVPDISTSKHFGGDEIVKPTLTSPLDAGVWTRGGVSEERQDVDAHHLLSNRHFELSEDAAEKAWPDIDIVVPFFERVSDKTGVVVGDAVPPKSSGGYDIRQEIHKLELFDLVHNTVVPGVKAVWADELNAQGKVEHSMLHVLGTDPYSWITPHSQHWSTTTTQPRPTFIQFFGHGADEEFSQSRRFDQLVVRPATSAMVSSSFEPLLGGRVLLLTDGTMSFLWPGGTPLAVESVDLYVISTPRKVFFVAQGGASVRPLAGGLELVRMTVPVSPATDRLELKGAMAIFCVVFRSAQQSYTALGTRTLLKPGRYRLTLEGRSDGSIPGANTEGFPLPDPVEWKLERTFGTAYPPSARPYIYYATFGDTRLFSKPQPPWDAWTADRWNPTQYGFGFPAYQRYAPTIRFLAPYIGDIYDELRAALTWDGGTNQAPLSVVSAADGISTMPAQAKAWLTAGGAAPAPDAEVVLTNALPAGKIVNFALQFKHPAGGWKGVDEWSFRVSDFLDFADHLAWSPTCLTVRYDAAGRHEDPPCPSLGGKPPRYAKEWFKGVANYPQQKKNIVAPRFPKAVELLPTNLAPPASFPQELTAAPATWRLPSSLTDCLGPLDTSSQERFTRFAVESDARFGSDPDKLAGLVAFPDETELTAVCDAGGRPLAFWLRTPEPIDWRRVTMALTVRHVEPGAGCPTAFASRHPLVLSLQALPSTDGSSAFLVASFAATPIALPRGQYELTLRFNPNAPGLPPLRPGPTVAAVPEHVTYKFLQPYGATWPLPTSKGHFRFDHIQVLVDHVAFDPHIWEEAVARDLSADELRRRIEAAAHKSYDVPIRPKLSGQEDEE